MARADEPEPAPKPRDLGPPMVDNLKDLKQLGKYAAWLDPKNKQVVLVGETCKADYPLEFFITTKARAYESVLVIDGERREGGPNVGLPADPVGPDPLRRQARTSVLL